MAKNIKCKSCGKNFLAKKDHSVWPKYCSRKCFLDKCIRPIKKNCKSCGKEFMAGKTNTGKTTDGRRDYCSNPCRHNGLKNGRMLACPCCNKKFYIHPSTEKQRSEKPCCSIKCSSEFYAGSNNSNWKGGKYIDQISGEVRMYSPRPGYSGNHPGEHRIVAGKIVGRVLEPYEKILHINNIKHDNEPNNLFICESISECSSRIHGSLPWPEKTNVFDYK